MELAFMRSTLAYALFWLNLISTGLILTLSLLSFNTLYIILYNIISRYRSYVFCIADFDNILC